MLLKHDFVVEIPVDEAWDLLLDLDRVAPCMPGAALLGRDGDDIKGTLQIKVGPIGADFAGTVRFLTIDETNRTAEISAVGNDTRGRTSAKAKIYARLEPDDGRTRVHVDTDLTLTGKFAQFGRGAIMDISTKMIDQFTANLQAQMQRQGGGVASSAASASDGGGTGENELSGRDLVTMVGPVVLKKAGPPLAVAVLVWLIWTRRGRR